MSNKLQLLNPYLLLATTENTGIDLSYASERKIIILKKTFVPINCFYCNTKSSDSNGGQNDNIFCRYSKNEITSDFSPYTVNNYCDNPECVLDSKVSEQVHYAINNVAFIDTNSPAVKNNINVLRTNGDVETNWNAHYYIFSDTKLKVFVTTNDKKIFKYVWLDEFMKINPQLKKDDLKPVFDEWYPPSVKNNVLKLYNECIYHFH